VTRRRGAPRPLAAAAGLALDRLLPEPPGIVHPVVLFGIVMTGLERRMHRDARGAGLLYALAGVALGLSAGAVVRSTALATSSAVAGRALAGTAREVGEALEADDLERARELLPSLVGRDPSSLGSAEIARAVVESVAENTVDAVVAPAFWSALAGAPGALGYRSVNTLDSMVGHRSLRYANFGWASARLDDALAWVPARLTAVVVAVVRPQAARAVWAALGRKAPGHPSPNAGVGEAGLSAALGVRLGGMSTYGDRTEERPALGSGRPPGVDDIGAAVRLSGDVTAALAGALALIGCARWWGTR